MVSKV